MKMKLIITFFIILLITYGAIGNYFYNYALDAKDEKEFLEDNPHLRKSDAVVASIDEYEKQADSDFIEEHSPKNLYVTSNDLLELKLHANIYEHKETNSKWAIVVHGYTSKASHMTRWVRNFYDEGYNVLAPDLRGHGESEGNYIGMGWHDRLDILLWIDEITKLDPNAEILLFGVSMGGATVMMTSGEDLPNNVKVVVEDCGYSSVSDVFTYQLDDLFGLPEFPVLYAANTITKLRAGYNLYEASSVKQVSKSDIPMLFIHGDDDTFVPYEMMFEVYEASKGEKEKLVIEGAGHGESIKVNPDLYWNTIWNFVNKFM